MKVDAFDFALPPERIALRPAAPRDEASVPYDSLIDTQTSRAPTPDSSGWIDMGGTTRGDSLHPGDVVTW